jgi:hypothetical protein
MALKVRRHNPRDGLCMIAAWTSLLLQASSPTRPSGRLPSFFYLHLARSRSWWNEARETLPAAAT